MSRAILREWTTESGRHFRLFADGEIWLDNERGRMLLSGWEPAFARELSRLAAENAKLRACVKAADARRLALSVHEQWETWKAYDAARAELAS